MMYIYNTNKRPGYDPMERVLDLIDENESHGDPNGSYTGKPIFDDKEPEQDNDDI
ncbi:MAG: hypothetical protein FWH14_04730 [Oscillospiraceae bacterium]|nr:hypothetical protein [Oscillospiraceae bacterium]